MKFKLTFEYDGSRFYGYQLQRNELTIQGEIERVLKEILHTDVRIYSSGRTDRGVHARNQVCHFRSDNDKIDYKRAINSLITEGIYIKDCEKVDDDFHARYSAVGKEYQYIIAKEYSVFDRNYKTYLNREIDYTKVREIMKIFVGTHDFRNFCTIEEDKDTVREIFSFDLEETNDDYIFTIRGTGFLRYMVRMIMGSVIEYGQSRVSYEHILEMLKSPQDEKLKFKASPNGLYLNKVIY